MAPGLPQDIPTSATMTMPVELRMSVTDTGEQVLAADEPRPSLPNADFEFDILGRPSALQEHASPSQGIKQKIEPTKPISSAPSVTERTKAWVKTHSQPYQTTSDRFEKWSSLAIPRSDQKWRRTLDCVGSLSLIFA